MIELKSQELVFSFPEVHPHAVLQINFQRTLRIPDDGRDYPLPPGLGSFPLRHVDDFAARVPDSWVRRGGVMFPMHQTEAMWIHLSSRHSYPFAVKVATGKVNAVTGESWRDGIHRDPQDYMVAPRQPWLDGYCVEKGVIRQFVAMPLGEGYTVEEQLSGAAEHGGIQIVVYPMKAEAYRRLFRPREMVSESFMDGMACCAAPAPDFGLGAGGRMRQEVYSDDYSLSDWDQSRGSRCFVHLANSESWEHLTGEVPPPTPASARSYTTAGLPWYDYEDVDNTSALGGGSAFGWVKSIKDLGKEKGESPLLENESAFPAEVVKLRKGLRKDEVRQGVF